MVLLAQFHARTWTFSAVTIFMHYIAARSLEKKSFTTVFFILLHDRESSLRLRSCGGESSFEACSSGFADQRRQKKYRHARGHYKSMHFVDLRLQSPHQRSYSAYIIFHCCVELRFSSHASDALILICKCHAVERKHHSEPTPAPSSRGLLELMSDPTRYFDLCQVLKRKLHRVKSALLSSE